MPTRSLMYALFIVCYLGPAAFAGWSIWRLFRSQGSSFWLSWQRAFGLLCLSTLPVLIVQLLTGLSGGFRYSIDFLESLIVIPGSWYVLWGGHSVISVFEKNVKSWTGHRRDTMLDNAHIFFALVFVQLLVLTLVVATRFRAGAKINDPVVASIGVFAGVNALLGMSWMWLGT
ncbi:MAG: hypothetical protein ACI841_004985 [Planctomycetota bacterium]|jgi:hypothetical protein